MKIGSIVLCEHSFNSDPLTKRVPIYGERLTVRDIHEWQGEMYLCFEEFIIGYVDSLEIGALMKYFRELLPPEAMQEQIKELLEEPVHAVW